MRTVILATSYPSAPGDAAGHFVRAEALLLAREGHEVHVIAPAPLREAGLEAHAAGGEGLFSWPGAAARANEAPLRLALAPAFGLRAAWLLRKLRPSRLIAHWAVPCGWPIALLAGQADFEIVSHGADARLLLALPAPLRQGVVAALLGRGVRFRFVASLYRDTLLATLTPALASLLERASRVEPPRVEVSGIKGKSPRDARVIVLARLVPDKRVHLAIEAVSRLPGLSLLVAGDGPERARLEALAARLAPGRVQFVGQLARPEALARLAESAVLLHPSAVEAAPTAVLEALALSTPVVACDAGDLALWARSTPLLEIAAPEAAALAAALDRAIKGRLVLEISVGQALHERIGQRRDKLAIRGADLGDADQTGTGRGARLVRGFAGGRRGLWLLHRLRHTRRGYRGFVVRRVVPHGRGGAIIGGANEREARAWIEGRPPRSEMACDAELAARRARKRAHDSPGLIGCEKDILLPTRPSSL